MEWGLNGYDMIGSYGEEGLHQRAAGDEDIEVTFARLLNVIPPLADLIRRAAASRHGPACS